MAIAFQSAANGDVGASPFPITHNTSGSAIVMLIGIVTDGGDVLTGVSGSVSGAATQIAKRADSGFETYLYYLAVGTGVSQTLTATASSGSIYMTSVAYSGASQTGIPDAQTNDTSGTGSPINIPLTTIADNCWLSMWYYSQTDGSTASTNTTLRATNAGFGGLEFFDSNGAKSPAGSYSLNVSDTGTGSWVIVSLAPAGGGAGPNDLRVVLGEPTIGSSSF